MCRILFKRDNQNKFDKDELKRSYETNPDGTGILYYDASQDKMVVHKWLADTKFEDIYKYLSEVEKNPDAKNIAIHFRIGTSGEKGFNQIHPQHIKNDMYLFHNGIMRQFDVSEKESDTQWMAKWLADTNFSFDKLENPEYRKIYENIFSSNKLLIIEKDKFVFLNEDLGQWDKGVWKSWTGASITGWDYDYIAPDYQTSVFDSKEIINNEASFVKKGNKINPKVTELNEEIKDSIYGLSYVQDRLEDLISGNDEWFHENDLDEELTSIGIEFDNEMSTISNSFKKILDNQEEFYLDNTNKDKEKHR